MTPLPENKEVTMAITDWPAEERPREKLLHLGRQALSDAELLAILLRTGSRGQTAVDVARGLLNDFGSLRALLDAGQQEFCARHGLGVSKYTQFQSVIEIGRRYLYESLSTGPALTQVDSTRDYLTITLRAYPYEVFACLFLDNRHHVIAFEELFNGTINGASVHPREVVKRALHHNAAAVIFAHNHPSGVAEPSQADRQITERLKQALDLVDIRVLDHFVIGDGQACSFAERGLI
jgi:DNA repair protein RadC